VASATASARSPATHGPNAVPQAAIVEASAKELFTQANAARRAGDDEGARVLYVELERRFPASRESQVARIALGRLFLERMHDPEAALAQFDRFLRQSPGAPLAEEALFGRATSLMQLGRTSDERETWILLLDRFPDSVFAERGRARLSHLK
jgi:TolA-binding protein